MADVNNPGLNLLFLRDEELRQGIELLFSPIATSPPSPTQSWRNTISAGRITA